MKTSPMPTDALPDDTPSPLLALPDGPRHRVLSWLAAPTCSIGVEGNSTAQQPLGSLNVLRLVCRSLRQDVDAVMTRVSWRGINLRFKPKAAVLRKLLAWVCMPVGMKLSLAWRPDSVVTLAPALLQFSGSLRSLDLKTAGLLDEHMLALAPVIRQLTALTRLNLRYNGFEACFPSVAAAIRDLRSLQHLDLSGSHIASVEGAAAIGAALLGPMALTRLGLSVWDDMGLPEQACFKELAPGIVKQAPTLEYFELHGSLLGVENSRLATTALQQMSALTRLRMSGLAWYSGEELAPALEGLGRIGVLQRLDMEHCMLCGTDMHVLLPAFKLLGPCLRHLDLAYNLELCEPDYGVSAAAAISELTCLTHLVLSNICIWLEGVKVLAPAFALLKALVVLDLSNNSIDDDGVEVLVGALQFCPGLRTLDMRGNIIWERGEALLGQVKGLESLKLVS